jgi:hypothetical protein
MAQFEIPRAPVQREKSGSWDLPDGYERRLENFRMASREEARRTYRMNNEAVNISRYIRALMGDQLPQFHRKWRSSIVDNRLQKARYDHLAQLTDTKPVPEVSTQVDAYKEIASVITADLRYAWTRKDIDIELVRAADIADCYGTAFWRIGAAYPGNMHIDACGPDQVMPIQPGFDIQESSAVLFRTWRGVQWLKRKFPFSTANIEREILNQPFYGNTENGNDITFNRPAAIDEWTWNGLSGAMKRLLGVKGAPTQESAAGTYYKTIEVEEIFVDDASANESASDVIVRDPFLTLDQHNWWYQVRPNQRLFPRKRHMVFAGSRLLSDGPSPYWHGLYPFAVLRFNPVFWSFWGLSKYRDLLPLQMAINQILGGGMDLINRSLNPTAITKEGGVNPTSWRNFYPDMPGYKLRVGANVQLNDAMKYMDPPVIPSYVFSDMLRGWLAPEWDRMSGAVDIQGLSKKRQVPGGDTLTQMQDSLQTGMRLEERMLEVFLRDAGVQAISNDLQFNTLDNRLRTLGEMGLTKADFNMDLGNMLPEDRAAQPDFWKQFALTVSIGSMHSGAKDREKQIAINLASRGLLPIKEMYRVLEMPDPDSLMSELLKERAAGLMGGFGRQDRMTRGQRNGQAA